MGKIFCENSWFKWLILIGSLLLITVLALFAFQRNKGAEPEKKPLISKGAMDPSKINVPQVGLSDDEWDNSRGTVSDGQDTNSETEPTRLLTEEADSIVIYFSRSGSTELLASKVQAAAESDVLELTVAETYSSDYRETVKRANEERGVRNSPVLSVNVPDLSQYKTIYLGYPIWGMTLAEPVASFLETYGSQLAGKTVAPFSTNGGYGLGSSLEQIENTITAQGGRITLTEAYAIEGNKVDQADESLLDWFDKIGTLD